MPMFAIVTQSLQVVKTSVSLSNRDVTRFELCSFVNTLGTSLAQTFRMLRLLSEWYAQLGDLKVECLLNSHLTVRRQQITPTRRGHWLMSVQIGGY